MMSSSHFIEEARAARNQQNPTVDFNAPKDASFAAWIAPLRAGDTQAARFSDEPTGEEIGDVGISTAVRQRNGAPSKIERSERGTDGADDDAVNEGATDSDSDKNTNDNGILASIMASCTPREKPKIYVDCEHAGLPLRELDRMAQALHESVVAGRPKLSLGITLPELGEIRFDVQIAGKVVFIHAFVENERAASALALAISALRDRLEEHRLILGKLDVTSPGVRRQNGHPPAERPISGRHGKSGIGKTADPSASADEEGIHVLA